MTSSSSDHLRRRVFSGAAVVAGAVAVVFLAAGDGVSAPHLTGPLALLPRWGHAGVWLLLSIAFVVAAVRTRWQRVSGLLALVAAVIYALLVLAVVAA